jgi:hypothetical protein
LANFDLSVRPFTENVAAMRHYCGLMPCPPENVWTATGHEPPVFLDEHGRRRRWVALGGALAGGGAALWLGALVAGAIGFSTMPALQGRTPLVASRTASAAARTLDVARTVPVAARTVPVARTLDVAARTPRGRALLVPRRRASHRAAGSSGLAHATPELASAAG